MKGNHKCARIVGLFVVRAKLNTFRFAEYYAFSNALMLQLYVYLQVKKISVYTHLNKSTTLDEARLR
jgi:hypothetical protein